MKIELTQNVKIFWYFVFFSFFIEWMHEDIHECINNTQFPLSVLFLLGIHHIINTFVLFGWLYDHLFFLLLYISSPFIAWFHWNNNNGMCQFSIEVNKNCGWEDSKMLNDILKVLNLKNREDMSLTSNLYVVFVLFGMIKSMMKIKFKAIHYKNSNENNRRIKLFKTI